MLRVRYDIHFFMTFQGLELAISESGHRDLLTKYLFERGYLPGKFLCVRGIGVSWKIVCVRGLNNVFWKIVGVRGLDRASWKMSICSMRK